MNQESLSDEIYNSILSRYEICLHNNCRPDIWGNLLCFDMPRAAPDFLLHDYAHITFLPKNKWSGDGSVTVGSKALYAKEIYLEAARRWLSENSEG